MATHFDKNKDKLHKLQERASTLLSLSTFDGAPDVRLQIAISGIEAVQHNKAHPEYVQGTVYDNPMRRAIDVICP